MGKGTGHFSGGGVIKGPKQTESKDGVLKKTGSTLPASANKKN